MTWKVKDVVGQRMEFVIRVVQGESVLRLSRNLRSADKPVICGSGGIERPAALLHWRIGRE